MQLCIGNPELIGVTHSLCYQRLDLRMLLLLAPDLRCCPNPQIVTVLNHRLNAFGV